MLIVVAITAVVCSYLARSESLIDSQGRNALPPKDFKSNDECVDLLESLLENIEDSNQYQDGNNACSDMVRVDDIKCKCRHDTYVFLEWKADHEGHHDFPLNNITFLVEKWSYNYTQLNSTWTEHSWAKSKKHKIDGLSRNTEYKFRVTPYLNRIQIGQSTISDNILTHSGNETLEQLRNVRVKQYSDQHGSVTALLTWDPPIDEVCVVTIIITEQGENGLDIKKAVADNTCELDGLRYQGSYTVILYSSLNRAESEKVTHSFDTPSCSSLHNYDPMKCAPETPQNLKVEDWCTNFTITWDKPPVDPDYYFIMFTYDQYSQNFTVQGNETGLKFETGQFGVNYFVYMTASGPSGSSKPNFVWNLSKCLELSQKQALMKEVTTKGLEVKRALTVPENLRLEGNCEPEIQWDKPSEDPLYYLVSVNLNNVRENFTISGNLTSFKLDKMSEGQLIIYLAAFSSDGELGQDSVSANVTCEEYLHQSTNVSGKYPVTTGTASSEVNIIMLLIIGMTVPVIIFLLIMVWLKYFPIKNIEKDIGRMQPEGSFRKEVQPKKAKEVVSAEPNIQEKPEAQDVVYDEYEVNRDNIRLNQVLGEGEFGVVHKAVLVENNTYLRYVAVKTLRNKESMEEKRQLEKEMEVMKSVGKHRNIVSLLGCCTQDMMLIVEYCSLGDLRRFLRKTWRMKSYVEEAITDKSNKNLLERRAFSNILYEQSVSEKRHLHLSLVDLLSFARQIALGMAYLSENRVVHRDVAARNVLLADDMTAKIADFGLSRDVYERNIYMKRSSDRLPLRWMALESLQYQLFSTKSDVWSYGILLWEIMTLGGCPYPSLQTSELYKLLQEGYRMEKPKPCSPQLYDIMLNCWNAKPQSRPSFPQLVLKVEEIMENESNRPYLDLSTYDYKNHLDTGCDIST